MKKLLLQSTGYSNTYYDIPSYSRSDTNRSTLGVSNLISFMLEYFYGGWLKQPKWLIETPTWQYGKQYFHSFIRDLLLFKHG